MTTFAVPTQCRCKEERQSFSSLARQVSLARFLQVRVRTELDARKSPSIRVTPPLSHVT